MEKERLDTLVEDFFKVKEETMSFDFLCEAIEEVLDSISSSPIINIEEQEMDKGQKFVLSLPKLAISEAWGDPNSMDRQQIDKIFAVVRGGSDISARIAFLNDYLNPAKAKRKTSPRVIINSMMIIESLKAALNHFNEASAGFVFEGFMSALTGGYQQAGKVGGTLPIEDFVAFSQFGGKNVPVSLKLLSESTYIKGSFTNLVDYLFIRGETGIKYLIAYKEKEEAGGVGKLRIYDFDITQNNIIDFLVGSSKLSRSALGDVPPEAIKSAIASGDQVQIAKAFVSTPGYTKAGMLNKVLQDAVEKERPEPEEEPSDLQPQFEGLETFHLNEKQAMLNEGGGDPTQWAISKAQMERMGDSINLSYYGEMDFTSARINEIANIYSKRLGDQVLELLESVQSLTNNIGSYYAERTRAKALQSGQGAIKNAETIETNLKQQVSGEEK